MKAKATRFLLEKYGEYIEAIADGESGQTIRIRSSAYNSAKELTLTLEILSEDEIAKMERDMDFMLSKK